MTLEAQFESLPVRYPELAGRVALVTGSSRGIGKGIALRLAREGMKVVINSRTPAAVQATTAEFQALGVEAVGRRPITTRQRVIAHQIGFVFLVGAILAITFIDVSRFIGQ